MAFFKRKLSPVERLEIALKEKQVARQRLAIQSSTAEKLLEERRAGAERLAIAGAADAQLAQAEAELRAVDEQAKTLRAALAEFDEQILATERALADATSQRDRESTAGRESMGRSDRICGHRVRQTGQGSTPAGATIRPPSAGR